MTQTAIVAKWKFVLTFEDDETAEISAAIGEADSEEECEALIEYEMQHHRSLGKNLVDAEAGEVCAECDGGRPDSGRQRRTSHLPGLRWPSGAGLAVYSFEHVIEFRIAELGLVPVETIPSIRNPKSQAFY